MSETRSEVEDIDGSLYERAYKTLEANLAKLFSLRNGTFRYETKIWIAVKRREAFGAQRLLCRRLVPRDDWTGDTWRVSATPKKKVLMGKEGFHERKFWVVTNEEIVIVHDPAKKPQQATLF